MVTKPHQFTAAFRRSVDLLIDLHHEMSSGDPDGKRADEIREEMEIDWHELSDHEQSLLRGLSADLYSIGQTWQAEPQIPVEAGQPIWKAIGEEQWEVLLNSTRAIERTIPPEGVAYFRGVAWFHLGQPNVAAEFFAEAIRTSKRVLPAYLHYYLYTLLALGRVEEAVPLAEQVVAESEDPLLLLDAAEVFFVQSTTVSNSRGEEILNRARKVALRGLRIADQVEKDDVLSLQYALTHLWLALDYVRSNNVQSAKESVAIAQEIMPSDPAVLFVDTWLRQKSQSVSWDQGIGSGLVRLRGLPVTLMRQVGGQLTAQ